MLVDEGRIERPDDGHSLRVRHRDRGDIRRLTQGEAGVVAHEIDGRVRVERDEPQLAVHEVEQPEVRDQPVRAATAMTEFAARPAIRRPMAKIGHEIDRLHQAQ